MPGTGWSSTHAGVSLSLKEGVTPLAIDGPNLVEITVQGSRIKILLNGGLVVDFVDQPLSAGDGGTSYPPLTHGGAGVQFGWEDTGTIDNLQVDPLP
jgi:hypothetical protein